MLGFRAVTIRVIRPKGGDTGASSASIQFFHNDVAGTATADTIATIAPIQTLTRATATNGNIGRFEFDWKGFKRYMRVQYTAGTGTSADNAVVIADCYRPEQAPATAASLLSSGWGTGSLVRLFASGPTTTFVNRLTRFLLKHIKRALIRRVFIWRVNAFTHH